MSIKKIQFYLVFIICSQHLNASDIKKTVSSQYGFIENKGQIVDQNNQCNASVLYLYNGNGLNVHLRQAGFSYEIVKVISNHQALTSRVSPLASPVSSFESIKGQSGTKHQLSPDSFYRHRIDISFIGANTNANILPSNQADDFINSYNPQDHAEGVTNLHHYRKVFYKNMYPNIDVEFILSDASNNSKFKYNFIVHPGGNTDDIKFKIDGAMSTSLTRDGHIIIETAYGNIDESIPLSYQVERNNHQEIVHTSFIQRSYDAGGSTSKLFGIGLGKYDATKILVIDPAPWATYYGGNDQDLVTGVTTDTAGNVICVGSTGSLSGIATTGAYQTVGTGGDLFCVKFNSSGVRLWATYYTTNCIGNFQFVIVDAIGNIFMTGITGVTSGFATTGVQQVFFGGGEDAFIIKMSGTGARVWATYYGGNGNDGGYDISLDNTGNIILGGFTTSTSGMASSGAYQTTFGGGSDYDGFVAKFNSSGVRIWGTYYGTNMYDQIFGVAADASGNVYATGTTLSTTGLASAGALHTTSAGTNDVILVKFNSSGTRQWATYYGSWTADLAYDIITEPSGNILITGYTGGDSSVVTPGAFQTVSGGGEDGFISRFSPSGNLLWATLCGGSNADEPSGIALDAANNIIITGTTTSTSGLTSPWAYQTIYGGGSYDAFVSKYSSNGTRLWTTYFGGAGYDESYSVAAGKYGDIFFGLFTQSTSGMSTPNAFQTSYGGGWCDGFVTGFRSGGCLTPPVINGQPIPRTVCENQSATFNVSASGGTLRYKWMKGGVNVSNGDSAYFIITNPLVSDSGNYSVAVIGACDTTYSIPVHLTVLPQPGINMPDTVICFKQDSILLDAGAGFTTYLWSSGDTSRTKWVKTGGVYSVIVWNIYGCHKFDSTRVIFTKGIVNKDTIVCYGAQVNIIAVSGASYTKFNWSTNDSTGTISVRPINNITYLCVIRTGSFVFYDSVRITLNPVVKVGFTISNQAQCLKGNNFTFIDTSAISSGTLRRLWNFGNGVYDTSTFSIQNKVYSTANNYTVSLVETSNKGCVDSAVKIIMVHPNPKSGFMVNNPVQCLNINKFIFTDTSTLTSGSMTRKWNFGTGNNDTSGSSNPVKIYAGANSFQIKLFLVSDFGCKDSSFQQVTVNVSPQAGFVTNNANQCVNGNKFIFNDSSTISAGTLTRIWNFGNGINDTSTLQGPFKIFTSTGSYPVKLVAISNWGCKDTSIKTVTVYPKPSVGFKLNSTSQCIDVNNFSFNDTSFISSGSLTRQWNFGNGNTDTSSLINPIKVYGLANIYQVQLVSVSSNGCKDSLTKSVMVNNKPKVGFDVSNLSQCINGNGFYFSDTSSGGIGALSRIWNFGSGITDTSTTLKPVKHYVFSGTYSVKLIEFNNGCKDSAVNILTVYPKPIVGFTVNKSGQCYTGNQFELNDTSNISSGFITRIWNFGDTTTSLQLNPVKSYSVAGVYPVQIRISSDHNCVDSIIRNMTVFARHFPGFLVNNDFQCLMDNLFHMTDTTGGTLSRIWDFGDSTTDWATVINKTYPRAGLFNVKLKTVDLNFCYDSITHLVAVNQNPAKPLITAVSNTLLQCTPAASYQWYLNGVVLSGFITQTLTLITNGNYKVKIDSTDGCSNVSDQFAAGAVGISQSIGLESVTLFPNPATGELYISIHEPEYLKEVFIEVYDLKGSILISSTNNGDVTGKYAIDICNLNDGMYFIKVNNKTLKFVKQN